MVKRSILYEGIAKKVMYFIWRMKSCDGYNPMVQPDLWLRVQKEKDGFEMILNFNELENNLKFKGKIILINNNLWT